MRTYDLDFETLLSLLKGAHQTGVLSTKLAAGFFGQKIPCLVRVSLIEGDITYCYIEDEKGGIQFAGNIDKKLLNVLYDLGIRSWLLDTDPLTIQSLSNYRNTPNNLPFIANTPSFTPNPPPLAPNTSSFAPNTSSFASNTPSRDSGMKSMSRRFFSDVPCISTNIGPEILHTLSRRHRRVLALVDGKRSAEKIAALLFSAPKDAWIVLTLLQEMESMRLITWINR